MVSHVSPYALLCASRPRPAASVVTPYDLYSRLQQEAAVQQPTASPAIAQENPPVSDMLPSPARKTHYISDIHQRHSKADLRASFIHQPLT